MYVDVSGKGLGGGVLRNTAGSTGGRGVDYSSVCITAFVSSFDGYISFDRYNGTIGLYSHNFLLNGIGNIFNEVYYCMH